jgi:molecular chaperone Hsp33
MSDQLHVFIFERLAVRGAIVQLDTEWRSIRALHSYPHPVERLLGEALVATALLASTLKSAGGSLLLQMQGDGPLSLMVAECSSEYGLRCTARCRTPVTSGPLPELIGNGRCAITLGNTEGAIRYQGIVPLEAPTLAGTLESYMARSEQLETRLALFADEQFAGGILLQRIPDRDDPDPDDFNRVVHLGVTASANELRQLSAPGLLRRLFPEDDVRVFGGRALRSACTCTADRVGGMLKTLGAKEVDEIIAEQGLIEVTCEFCNRRYRFGPRDAASLFERG